MPHLWLQREEDGSPVWVLVSLDGDRRAFHLTDDPERPVVASTSAPTDASATIIGHGARGNGTVPRGDGPHPKDTQRGGQSPSGTVPRHVSEPDPAGTWMLYAAPEPTVCVNGRRLDLGIHHLAEKDEIRVGPNLMLFSAESLPRVESFPGTGKPRCPRCRQPIDAGSDAVKCPTCRVWYHQSEELPCYTYGETCCLCSRPTDLEGGYSWTPDDP